MTPIGWPGGLFSAVGPGPRPRPIVMYISSLALFSSVAMWTSGLRISTPAGRSMSLAVMSPGPVTTSGASISVASECMRHTMPLRFSTMSVTSSETPLIVENSCATPSIRTLVTAAPASELSSARRRELPNVKPKPRSSGSMVNEPRLSSTCSEVIRGIWKSSIGVLTVVSRAPRGGMGRCAARSGVSSLLGVQLDDELLLHRRRDLATLGLAQHLGGERVMVGLEPRRHLGRELRRVADELHGAGVGLDGDDIAVAHLIAGDVHAAAVDRPVAVADEPRCVGARRREAEADEHVVEAALEEGEQVLAGDAGLAGGPLVVVAELLLER